MESPLTIMKRLRRLLLLVLLQVFVCNRINLFGYATPLLYVCFIIDLDSDVSANMKLIWGAAIGIMIDFFSATPGLNMAAALLLAYVQPWVMSLFISTDRRESVTPDIDTLGTVPFIGYVTICVLFHHLLYFLLKCIPVADWNMYLFKVLTSALMTVVILAVFYFSRPKVRRRIGD